MPAQVSPRDEALLKLLSAVGTKVMMGELIDRWPHFKVPAGRTSTVASCEDYYGVKLDQPLDGAEAWHNEVHWYFEDNYLEDALCQVLPI